MADIYEKHRSATLKELSQMGSKEFKKLTPAEVEVYNVIVVDGVLDTLPLDFFRDNTVEQLNKHFGGHDDMVITENLREALDGTRLEIDWLDQMVEIFPSLPEK